MAIDEVDGTIPSEEDLHGQPLALAEQMVKLARVLQSEKGESAVLARMVRAAIELIPGVDEASITLVTKPKRIETRAPSGNLARQVDAVQEKTGQGPCLDSVYEEKTVSVPDMANESRWPRFSAEAFDLGVASMLSFQLFADGNNLGALNLYSREADAFDEESVQVGLLVASHAAVVFAGTQKVQQMRDALLSRDLIGQAKGILMERYKITAGQAFVLLAQASSLSNVKLFRIAEDLVATGDLQFGAKN